MKNYLIFGDGNNPYTQQFMDQLVQLASGNNVLSVFRDFVEMIAFELRCFVDTQGRVQMTERLKMLKARYTSEQHTHIEALTEVLLYGICYNVEHGTPDDILGFIYSSITGKSTSKSGTVYTPSHISHFIGNLAMLGEEIECYPSIEGCIGSGRISFGYLRAMAKQGVDYMKYGLIFGNDNDITGVHMAFIQFNLYRVPACIYHKDMMSDDYSDPWMTVAYVQRYCGGQYVDNLKGVYGDEKDSRGSKLDREGKEE